MDISLGISHIEYLDFAFPIMLLYAFSIDNSSDWHSEFKSCNDFPMSLAGNSGLGIAQRIIGNADIFKCHNFLSVQIETNK